MGEAFLCREVDTMRQIVKGTRNVIFLNYHVVTLPTAGSQSILSNKLMGRRSGGAGDGTSHGTLCCLRI